MANESAVRLPEGAEALGWPLWRQVEQGIVDAIAAGRLRAGERIPGEHRLTELTGAHRHTVRRAVASLTARGVLSVRRGLGVYVAGSAVEYRIGPRSRFTENVVAAGLTPGVRVLRASVVVAGEMVAGALALEPGEAAVSLTLLRTADAVPLVLAQHFLPASRFADFAERFREIRSVTRTFASYGVEGYTRRVTRISARVPTVSEARDLAMAEGVPVLVWESVNADRLGRPVDLDVSTFPSSRVRILLGDADENRQEDRSALPAAFGTGSG